MKGSRAAIMIGVSCVAAMSAVVLASQWMNEQADLSTRKIVVAANDIDLGTKLAPEMVRLADWPVDSVPSGAFTEINSLETRVTRVGLQRGEPLLDAKLALPGAAGGLSAVVAEGKRAMTVRVNDVIGVAGFALPGNYVDILVSTQNEEKNKKDEQRDLSVSKVVLERILVLAVAQEASVDDTAAKVVNAVTLEVTPEQAEKLDLARSVGTLSLVLRNQVDVKPAATTGATKETLLGLSEAKPAAPAETTPAKPKLQQKKAAPRAPANCQQVITGTGRITQCY